MKGSDRSMAEVISGVTVAPLETSNCNSITFFKSTVSAKSTVTLRSVVFMTASLFCPLTLKAVMSATILG